MAAASAKNIAVLTFGNTVTWKFKPQKESTDDTDIMKLTDEIISQPADSKAVHRVYSKQCMVGTKATDTHVDVSR